MKKNIEELNQLSIAVHDNIHNLELEIKQELEKGNFPRVEYLKGMKDALHYMSFKIGSANRGVKL